MKKAGLMAKKPQCINLRLFNPNLVAVESCTVKQVINKNFRLGFALFKYRKLYIYRTYATLKINFCPLMHMLYTSTDSLILRFFTYDLYKELLDVPELRGMFDFRKSPASHHSQHGFLDDPN